MCSWEDRSSDDTMVSFYKRRQFDHLPGFMKQIRDVKTAESCITIGAGAGKYEVPFMRQCLPDLELLTSVEPNPKSNEKFAEVLRTEFPRLKYAIEQSRVEDWTGPDQQVDVVLAFHVLYFIQSADREEFYENCFTKWLKPNGKLVVMIADEKNFMMVILDKLWAHRKVTSSQSIAADLKALGYTVEKVYRCESAFNLADPDDDFLRLFQYVVEEQVDMDFLRRIIKELAPNGGGDEIIEVLVVSQSRDQE